MEVGNPILVNNGLLMAYESLMVLSLQMWNFLGSLKQKHLRAEIAEIKYAT